MLASWQTALYDFEQKGTAKTLKYLDDYPLESSDGGELWASAWASVLWNAPPGHGPQTCQQSLERYNGTVKQAMPALGDMMKSLDHCNRAIMVERGHVDGQDAHRSSSSPLATARPAQRFRPPNDIGEQVWLALVWRFLEYLLDDLAGSTLTRAVPPLGEAQRVYCGALFLKQFRRIRSVRMRSEVIGTIITRRLERT